MVPKNILHTYNQRLHFVTVHFVFKVTDMTPHMVEEYVLETPERGASRIYHTRLTIYQRLANDEYLGELYVERDYKEGDVKGSTCRYITPFW